MVFKMKKTLSVILACVMALAVLFLIPFSSSGEDPEQVTLISKADTGWEYITYQEDTSVGLVATPPANWLSGSYNQGDSWTTAAAPFSAPSWANPSANALFAYQYYSAYLRIRFNLENASAVESLVMQVIYDENPHIYLNGDEIWTASGYHDSAYTTVNLNTAIDSLRTGENVLCVFVSNVYGGGLFDMSLTAAIGEPDPVQINYKAVAVSSVSTSGFTSFGDINKPENVLDNNQNTVTGSSYNAGAEQSVTLTLPGKIVLGKVFVQCKDEGTTTNADGSRGTYHLYSYNGSAVTDLGTIPAVTGTDGGCFFTLPTPVEADKIKVKIDSWQGDCWACVADVIVYEIPANDIILGVYGNGLELYASGGCVSTQLLLTIKSGSGGTVSGLYANKNDYVWEMTLTTDGGSAKTFADLKPISYVGNGTDLYVFEIDSEEFMPLSGAHTYAVGLSILEDGEVSLGSSSPAVITTSASFVPTPSEYPGEYVKIQPSEVTTTGFVNFGDINKPENVLDGDQNSVTGSGYNADVEQSVTLILSEKIGLARVFVQCKDEGTTTNPDGTRGTYHVYAYDGEAEIDLGTIPAVTGTDGGYTLTLPSSVTADKVKVEIVSWQGTNWACVADINVYEIMTTELLIDGYGDGIENGSFEGSESFQLLLTLKNDKGGPLSGFFTNKDSYEWKMTIVDENDVKTVIADLPPVSYLGEGVEFYRFIPSESDFLPKAGAHSYSVHLRISQDGVLCYGTLVPAELSTSADFIPSHDHEVTWSAGQAPSCFQEGTEIGYCPICGASLTRPVAKTPHTYGAPVFSWDGFEASALHVCSVCGAEEALDVTVSEEVLTPASCFNDGESRFTATVSVDGQTCSDSAVLTVPQFEHSIDLSTGRCTLCSTAFTVVNVYSDGRAVGADALDLLVPGGTTVKLFVDFALSQNLPVSSDEVRTGIVTLDLNGFTLSVTPTSGIDCITVGNNRKLVLQNGRVELSLASGAAGNGFRLQNRAKLTVSGDVTVFSEGVTCVTVLNHSTLVSYGELAAWGNFAVAGSGTSGNGGYSVSIRSGSVSAVGAPAVYHPNDGTVEISGGRVAGTTAVYQKSGSLLILGGTLVGNGFADSYEYCPSGVCSTGEALTVDSCGYPGGTPSVSIVDGVLRSRNADAAGSYATSPSIRVLGFAEGGSFSSPLPYEFCADSLCCVYNASSRLYAISDHSTHAWALDGTVVTLPTFALPGQMSGVSCQICGEPFEGLLELPAVTPDLCASPYFTDSGVSLVGTLSSDLIDPDAVLNYQLTLSSSGTVLSTQSGSLSDSDFAKTVSCATVSPATAAATGADLVTDAALLFELPLGDLVPGNYTVSVLFSSDGFTSTSEISFSVD